jgi:DNA repair protein RecO (recombination protein O)
MKQITTKAIILKRLNFGEADRILTILTPDHGKMSVLAKGARKSKSKLAGGLELFSISDITFIDGRSELKSLVSTRLEKHFGEIVGDMTYTMMAYDFLKMIDQATKESCDEGFFMLLQAGLESLSENPEHPDVAYIWFVDSLLKKAGVAINTETQVNGQKFDENSNYDFDYEAMGFTSNQNGKYSPKHVKFLRLLPKVSSPSHLLRISGSHAYSADVKQLLETCFKFYVHS